MSISIAMAVFNGEKYIKEQISSILNQLDKNDEIVISYDPCSDNTYKIISKLSASDNRIKIINGPGNGIIKNFENAFLHCKNEYIFLCDQDDIWLDNKVSTVVNAFKATRADVIIHDCIVINQENKVISNSFFDMRHCKSGFLYNIIHNSYIGCCMAVRREFLMHNILPFPKNIPMHDQWIGLVAEKIGKVEFINIPLLKYRRHVNNSTGLNHSSLFNMIKFRLNLIIALLKINKR